MNSKQGIPVPFERKVFPQSISKVSIYYYFENLDEVQEIHQNLDSEATEANFCPKISDEMN